MAVFSFFLVLVAFLYHERLQHHLRRLQALSVTAHPLRHRNQANTNMFLLQIHAQRRRCRYIRSDIPCFDYISGLEEFPGPILVFLRHGRRWTK